MPLSDWKISLLCKLKCWATSFSEFLILLFITRAFAACTQMKSKLNVIPNLFDVTPSNGLREQGDDTTSFCTQTAI